MGANAPDSCLWEWLLYVRGSDAGMDFNIPIS